MRTGDSVGSLLALWKHMLSHLSHRLLYSRMEAELRYSLIVNCPFALMCVGTANDSFKSFQTYVR